MNQLLLDIGLTLLVFGVGFRLFLMTDYCRRLLHKLEQERQGYEKEENPQMVRAVEEELILVRYLTPVYARRFLGVALVLLGLHFLLAIFG